MNRRGFYTVEIVLIVAIITLLAAIAIPALMKAQASLKESSGKLEKLEKVCAEDCVPKEKTYKDNIGEYSFLDNQCIDGGVYYCNKWKKVKDVGYFYEVKDTVGDKVKIVVLGDSWDLGEGRYQEIWVEKNKTFEYSDYPDPKNKWYADQRKKIQK